MTYIVGWHDLPAARVLVPAMKILDYVSPWVLEEWEYSFELELEEERAKLAEDKQREKREEVHQAQQGGAAVRDKKSRKKGQKRGRPPTHKHTQIEAGAVALPETVEEASRARMKPGTMSLSTPQKTRLVDFEDLSDEDGTPSRQTQPARGATLPTVEDMDVGISEEEGARVDNHGHSSQKPSEILRAPKITPVPLPTFPQSNAGMQRNLHGMFTTMNAGSGLSSVSSSKSSTPVPLPVLPSLRPTQSMTPAPAPQPSTSQTWASLQNGTRAASVSVVRPPMTTVLPPVVPPSAGSTPSVSSRPTSSNSQTGTSKPPKKRRKKAKPLLDENGAAVWLVKRIEDDCLFDVEGKGIERLYKVRWEGDWPPEQNPTWEPAANLPESMIRNWHKTAPKIRARLSKGLGPKDTGKLRLPALNPKKGGKMTQSKLNWNGGQKVSSVSDVFQSEADELDNDHQDGEEMATKHNQSGYDSGREEDQDDELFVLEKSADTGLGDKDKVMESISGARPSFASRMSSWGAFFGSR
jgi:hypothetical protein